MSGRRTVRVTQPFFDQLDELLPAARTASGKPSADFLLHEMTSVIDELADDSDRGTSPVPDQPGVRMFISAGVLVPFLAVYAVVGPDDSIDIVALAIEPS